MNRIARILAPMALALALGACSGEADVDLDYDSAAVDATTPAYQDTTGVDVTLGGEGIEKLVEASLIAAPGFGDVEVESGGEGVIILNGTVPTEADKAEAERLARGVSGVMTVTNNITLKP